MTRKTDRSKGFADRRDAAAAHATAVGARRIGPWSCRRPRRAVILVLTLWLVLVLAVLANSLGFEMQVEAKLTGAFRDQFQAEQLARIGVARAVTDLRNDRLVERVMDTPLTNNDGSAAAPQPFDAYGDVWTGGTLLPRYYEVERHGSGMSGDRSGVEGYYEVMVVDEESKLALAGGGPRSSEAMRYLLMELDVPEDLARQISNAITDWQDPDDIPVDGQGVSERLAYQKLTETSGSGGGRVRVSGEPTPSPDATDTKSHDQRLLPKNSRFGSVEELLQVPGITPKLFYGYDPEKEPEPSFFPTRSMGGERRTLGLRDLVSVRAKSMNLNTACYESLAADFAAASGDLDTGRQLAQRLIAYRQGSGTDRLDNRNAIRDMAKLQQIEGFTPALIHSLGSAVPLTITSDSFTIYSRASLGRKKEAVRGSFSHAGAERPVASSRIVVQCERQLLVYPIQMSEDGTEVAPIEDMPGYRAAYTGPHQGISMQTIGTANGGAWFVPVVYFKSWISD